MNERLAKETNFEDGRVKVYGIQPTHEEFRLDPKAQAAEGARWAAQQAAQQDMTQNPLSGLHGGGDRVYRAVHEQEKVDALSAKYHAAVYEDKFGARHWTPGKGFALACLVGAAVWAVVFAVIKWGW